MKEVMNPEIKKLWVEALRSGEYRQGKGCLRIKHHDGGDNYCCLGVLSDLAVKAGVGKWGLVDGNGRRPHVGDGKSNDYLTDDVMRWAGLTHSNPPVVYNRIGHNTDRFLSALNDNGVPFTDIADMIERSL